ncbi:hypothetical protein Bca4012_100101 [Brassica carinata]|uniref:Uncharacterized protein n=1 Tax=Brassica carinata TaxID=52824 RepID=A0A8X7PKU8_BRACI|nr:hypothetical protein Bca52824_082673 [Brassica carinata]
MSKTQFKQICQNVTFQVFQNMASHLEKASSVTFITSIAAAAFQPQVPTAIYGVTKTALLGLTKVP